MRRLTGGLVGGLAARLAALLVALLALVLPAGCVTPADGRLEPAAPSMAATRPVDARSSEAAARYADGEAISALATAVDQRLGVMRDVAAAKFIAGAPVQDEAREAAVLRAVAQRAQALGLDPVATQAFFAEQIRLARVEQERWLAQWRAAGRCEPCANPVPLQAVRERIDGANERQLQALYLLAPLRSHEAEALRHQLQSQLGPRGLAAEQVQALAALALSIGRSSAVGALDRIRSTEVLRIATTGDYAPFSLERDGQLTGADIDLGRELAAQLGVTPRFVRTSWPRLLDDLRDGRFDVAISGIGYTAERAALGLYSSAYQTGGKTLIARCSERERFDAPDKLDRPGVRVIVNPGGTNERYVREHVRRAQVIVHPDNREVFAEIAAGRADVMVTDDVEAELQARRWPGQLCRSYAGTLTQGDKRILMAPDPALQAEVESWLRAQVAADVPRRMLERAMQSYVQETDRP